MSKKNHIEQELPEDFNKAWYREVCWVTWGCVPHDIHWAIDSKLYKEKELELMSERVKLEVSEAERILWLIKDLANGLDIDLLDANGSKKISEARELRKIIKQRLGEVK